MDKNSIKALQIAFAMFIISIVALSYDQLTINTSLLVTLVLANFGLVLKNTFDIGELKGRFRIVENYVQERINERIKGE